MKTSTKIITAVFVAELTLTGAIAASTISITGNAEPKAEPRAEGTVMIAGCGPLLVNTHSADNDDWENIHATMDVAEQYITTDEDGIAYFEFDGQRWPVATYENGKHQLPVLG